MWDELWIGRDVLPRELISAIAKALGIPEGDVVVVEGIATEPQSPSPVIVRKSRGGGEFPTKIQMSGIEPDNRRVFCARLASALGTRILGDDSNINPLTFMMYEPGNATRVAVDPTQLEANAPCVIGPYVPLPDDDSHPTKPIRRYPEPAAHRSTRGGQVAHIVNDYMLEGLPRPPLVEWSPAMTEVYNQLHRLLSTISYREASAEELASLEAWSSKLAATFPDAEKAGWFLVEVLECAHLVLAEPWHPDKPALDLEPS